MTTRKASTRDRRPVRQRSKGPIDPAFGRLVRELRVSRDLTQGQLAGSDFTKGFISLVETGRTRVSLRAAEIISARLGVSVAALMAQTGTTDQRAFEINLLRGEQALAAGRYDEALATAESVERLANGVTRAGAKRLRGRALLATNDPKRAFLPLDQAMREYRSQRSWPQLAYVLFELATAHARMDELPEAVALALQAENLLNSGQVVDRQLEVQLIAAIAAFEVGLGDFDAAEARAEQAAALAIDIADPRALGSLYGSLASTRQEQGDLEAALMFSRKSLEIFERLEDERAIANVWNTLAWVAIQRKEFSRARTALERAERLAGEEHSERLRPWLATTRAELALAEGDLDEALRLVESAATVAGSGTRILTEALFVRAQVVTARKAPLRKIQDSFDAALAAAETQPRKLRARIRKHYAKVLSDRGEIAAALAQAQRALDLLQPSL